MAQKLTEEEVRDVAELAHIALSDKEVSQFQKELGSILGYVDQLQEINTEDISEMDHITGLKNVYREDIVTDVSQNEKDMIMSNVPEQKDGAIKVKNVL